MGVEVSGIVGSKSLCKSWYEWVKNVGARMDV